MLSNPDFFYRSLGRTNLKVSCLGIGGGGGISSEDTLHAFDQGINYFFFSSDLHHCLYGRMAEGLKQLCGRQSSRREQVILATVTYMSSPQKAIAALFDQFVELKIDYIDVFFWGWIDTNDAYTFEQCINHSAELKDPDGKYTRYLEQMFGASERLKQMGAVRYIGASFHDLELASRWLNHPILDVVMVRHNIAHRNAQDLIFNQIKQEDSTRPGIVTFKSAGMTVPLWGRLPPGLPQDCWKVSVPELYRYSLSQNCVDVCLMGPTHRKHIDAAIAEVQKGVFTPEQLEYLNLYGDLYRGRLKIEDIGPEKLLKASDTDLSIRKIISNFGEN